MIAIAFYTENYTKNANNLKAELEKYSIKHDLLKVDFEEIEKLFVGDELPEVNLKHTITRYGAIFIKKMYKKYPDEDLLYLHADAQVRKPIEINLPDNTDIGVSKGYGIPIWMKSKQLSMDVLGAPILFKHNKKVKEFLNAYGKKVKKDTRNNGEQVIFSDVCSEFKFSKKLNVSYFGQGFAVNVLKFPAGLQLGDESFEYSVKFKQSVDYYDPQVVV